MRVTAAVVLASACLLSACTSSSTTSTPVQNTPAPSQPPVRFNSWRSRGRIHRSIAADFRAVRSCIDRLGLNGSDPWRSVSCYWGRTTRGIEQARASSHGEDNALRVAEEPAETLKRVFDQS
jgi:hypothetical protein